MRPVSRPKIIRKPTKDLCAAAVDMSKREVRFLIEDFYRWLTLYQATQAHVRILDKEHQGSTIVRFVRRDAMAIRSHMKTFLDIWSEQFPTAKWAKSVRGIGAVIAAGLTAFIDIDKCKTISSLWKHAGFDPNNQPITRLQLDKVAQVALDKFGEDLKEEHVHFLCKEFKRNPSHALEQLKKGKLSWRQLDFLLRTPKYNLTLKKICNSMGNSFVKCGNVYTDIFKVRKVYENTKNDNGDYAKQAQRQLQRLNFRQNSVAYKAYIKGKLPPGHIDVRARRYVIKIFLAHWYMVEYYVKHRKEPPDVYALDILHGHRKIHVPNFDKKQLRGE